MLEIIFNRTLHIGEGTLEKLPQLLKSKDKNNVLLVVFDGSSPFVVRTVELLKNNSINAIIYDKVKKEPDIQVIDEGVKILSEHNCDAVVAIGGGSVIDTAKAIALITTNGGSAEDYQMYNRPVTKEPVYFVAVPTTAGTGAEATKVSVIYNNNTGWKKAMYHNSMIAKAVILDPEAVVSLPPKLIASTGIDAITHAIESYFSLFANEITRMYSLKALSLLTDNIYRAYVNPKDVKAQENMLLGSYLAGYAIAAGTGLAHIIGQPVGALYGISHGEICSVFLPGSMRANAPYAHNYLIDIAKALGVDQAGKNEDEIIEAGIKRVEEIISSVNGPQKLTDYVPLETINIDRIIAGVQESMGHIKNNPRPIEPSVIRKMVEEVL